MKLKMNDQQRMLMILLNQTAGAAAAFSSKQQWEWVNHDTVLEKNDFIMGLTNSRSPYSLSFFEERLNGGDLVVRDINSGKLVQYTNEQFLVYRGAFSRLEKLTGAEWEFRLKVGTVLNNSFSMLALTDLKFENGRCVELVFRRKFSETILNIPFTHSKSLSKVTQKEISAAINPHY